MDKRKAVTDSQTSVSSLQQLVQSVAVGAEELVSVIREIILDEQFQQVLRSITAGVEKMVFWEWVERACDQSGFLPYRAVPFDKFYRESRGNYDLFSTQVSEYYKTHEENILQDIGSFLETLEDIDMDRKETLKEAIMAHRYGLFRLPVRALLPDVERIILEDWLGRDKGHVETLNDKKIKEVIKNKNLEDFAPDSIYDLRLFGCLINVLYKHVSKLKEFQGENFPNRHAALHGWLPYSTRESSLNTIIFTDYTLRLVPLFKENTEVGGKTSC